MQEKTGTVSMHDFRPFDPNLVTSFGSFGKETAEKMSKALENNNLNLSYDPKTKMFTVLGSSNLSKDKVSEIFKQQNYDHWEPQVTDETDTEGNLLVQLTSKPVNSPFLGSTGPASTYMRPVVNTAPSQNTRTWTNQNPPSTPAPPLSKQSQLQADAVSSPLPSDFRDSEARRLVESIRKLGIKLTGKTCLDIGCRSGENALAIQKAGAKVTGIDPDDSEFKTAASKGMEKEDLRKETLQEFCKTNESKKFDLATVFLWNISYNERESFVKDLTQVIHSKGTVIIGYHDDAYDKGKAALKPLLETVFDNVTRHESPDNLNKYLLVCENPKNPES